MIREQHLWIHAMEECAEVQQRISKGLRFGMEQIQQARDDAPEQNPLKLTNRQRIIHEYADLIAVMDMLGIVPDNAMMRTLGRAKKVKVERYLLMAQELGTLDLEGTIEDFTRRQKQHFQDHDD